MLPGANKKKNNKAFNDEDLDLNQYLIEGQKKEQKNKQDSNNSKVSKNSKNQ